MCGYPASLLVCRSYSAKNIGFGPGEIHHDRRDRATEWSARADKVEVQFEAVDVSSGRRIAKTIIKGRSGLATFGGDHPQDLLPEPIDEFVDQLFSERAN